ncbi:hypothetical protein [Actinomadura rayongensis]|uniref:Lipoprotein n=1 Tax=Actinomadura rayongensis TaxID=1429076 RepID=A0A6I4W2K9_9ACTN|nr:hypothetical protein [Actinomadura rayongensis]MXQ62940.1 hypothetical protein [Actinomadura rayongensis]
MVRIGLAVLGAVALFATGCGGGDERPARSDATTARSSATRLGGASTGVTADVPGGWRKVDPLTDASAVVRTSFGLTGENADLVRQLMTVQRGHGTVYALDGSVTGGMAPHLTMGCDSGGLTGASREQLERKQRALEPTSRITETTVGGKPAFRASYSSTRQGVAVDGLMVRASVSDERFCFVEIEAAKGGLTAATDGIAASFALA